MPKINEQDIQWDEQEDLSADNVQWDDAAPASISSVSFKGDPAASGTRRDVMGVASPQARKEGQFVAEEFIKKPAKSFAAKAAQGVKFLSLPLATDKEKERLTKDVLDLNEFAEQQVASPELTKGQQIFRTIEEFAPNFLPGGWVNVLSQGATDRPVSLIRQGVDDETAKNVSRLGLGTAGVSLALPGAGKTLGQTAGLVAASPAIGVAQRYAEKEMLDDQYPELAKQVNPLDPNALTIDTLTGILGATAGRPVRRGAPEFAHNNLETAAVTGKDSLDLQNVAPEVKPVVKMTKEEAVALKRDGQIGQGKVLFDAGNGVTYVLDTNAVHAKIGGRSRVDSLNQAKRMLKSGKEADLLNYPADRNGPTAAVTKQGEVVTDPNAIVREGENGNLIYGAEGRLDQLGPKVEEVAQAVRSSEDFRYLVTDWVNARTKELDTINPAGVRRSEEYVGFNGKTARKEAIQRFGVDLDRLDNMGSFKDQSELFEKAFKEYSKNLTPPEPSPVAQAVKQPEPLKTVFDQEQESLASILREEGIEEGSPLWNKVVKHSRSSRRDLDPLTGAQTRTEFDKALPAMFERHQKSGEPLTYAVWDIGNVNGMNAKLGKATTDKHIRAIHDIVQNTLQENGISDRQNFRNGGDEFQSVARPPKNIVDKAFAEAKNRVRIYEQENGLSEIPHPKGGKPGTDIYYAIEEFKDWNSVDDLISRADIETERQKILAKEAYHGSRETKKDGAAAPERQPAGDEAGTGQEGSGLRQPQETATAQGREGEVAAGSLAYGMDLPKMAGNINLERIDAGYPVKKLILDVADRNKSRIDEARRGTITQQETKQLANDLGMTAEQLLKRRKGQAFNAEEVTASRDILNTSATQLRKIQEDSARLGTDESLAQFRAALERHAAIQAEVSGASAEAGRALAAHRIMSSPSKNYREMLDAMGGREVNEEILKRFAAVDVTDMRQVNAFVKNYAKVKRTDQIFEAWINFLLSGPKTHIVNATSNTLTFFSKFPETLIAAGIEQGRARAAGETPQRFVGEAMKDALGGYAGIKNGVQAALKAWREELPADALLKTETAGRFQTIPGQTGKAIRIPTRALAAADEMFKSINYTAEMNSLAYRKAKQEGLSGAVLNNRVAELLQNPTKEMVDSARREADYRTFTQPYGHIGAWIAKGRNIPYFGGAFKAIVPFLRTPMNIAKFALERTPMNFARLAYKVKKGELSGAQISDEFAKPVLGSLIGAMVVAMAQEGSITGGGPKDKEERETLLRTGWQPYSMKVGDQYVPYGRLEPIGSVFGMSADFADLAMSSNDDSNLSDYAEGVALSISKNLTSKTFLVGLSNALDAMSDPKRYGEKWVNSYAATAVPSIVASGAQAADPVVRDTEGPADAIQARLPFLSQALYPKRDVWGREIERPGNVLERVASPAPVTVETSDPVDLEVKRLGLALTPPRRTLSNGAKLSPYQYDLLQKRSGERAYRQASNIVRSNMDDEAKRDRIKEILRQSHKFEAQRIQREFNLYGKKNK